MCGRPLVIFSMILHGTFSAVSCGSENSVINRSRSVMGVEPVEQEFGTSHSGQIR